MRLHPLRMATIVAVGAALIGVPPATRADSAAAQPRAGHGLILPLELLTRAIPDSTPDAERVRRGQYLVAAGDCMSCHLRDGGEPLAGGRGLNTPFGVIYAPNITSDRETGIGAWNSDQFYAAMHHGLDDEGQNLYPAFPYPWFTRVSRADDDAIFAFLKTTPAVHYTPPANGLTFPLNLRILMKAWNLLFFHPGDSGPDPARTPEWNRGSYLVNGLGHCGACHTPKNVLGADEGGRPFEGGSLDEWVAPDLTANARTGLGSWSVEDIAEYLQTGRNARAGAGGPMGEVVTYSTSLMSGADRHAIAVYLKDTAPGPEVADAPPDAGSMRRGAAIYSDACSSCHLQDGVGQPRLFPPLGHNASVQQNDPTGLEHLILAGVRVGTSPDRPSALAMPSFAWKLDDQEVADVATYIRNSWGNGAATVPASAVRKLRRTLELDTVHLTVNSGDRLP